jgi:hypothetical protein
VVTIGSGAPSTGGRLTVRELAYRAAAAANKQPNVPASQWVYWREQDGRGAKAHVWNVWTTADGKKAAYRYHGKVYPSTGSRTVANTSASRLSGRREAASSSSGCTG